MTYISRKLRQIFDTLTLRSSYPSDDVSGGTDGTSRLNLESYQRANFNSFGEVVRVFLKRKDAKGMLAWYMPKSGWNADRSANESTGYQPVTWVGTHFEANDHNSDHVHWEVEIPDSTGALQGRLEIPFANSTTGVIGLDKTWIITNLADFVVRTSNSQVLRLSSPSGNHKPIEFNHDAYGSTSLRRWIVRANSTAESTGNIGTDFQIVRYDDSGNLIDQAVHIDRKTGTTVLGSSTPTANVKLDINGDAIRLRTAKTPSSASDTGAAGQICWDSNFIYICVATNTWKRSALTTW